jgi:(p)ppGpp synthase/HD superfamily hydrolase
MDLKDIRILTKAYQIASIGHRLQKRKGVKGVEDPYINHPIEVCDILAECGINDLKVLCGAVLHDTVEDT